ncbi:MAG: hypothetical protein Kow0013_11580 [Pararhodobacter sp.]
MRLVLHIGAHGTDDGLIAGYLAQNRAALQGQGVLAPSPRAFVRRLSDVLDRERDADPRAREEALLRSFGASGQRRWLAVSAPGLLGPVTDILQPEGFYSRDVARRMLALRTLFPRCALTILLAVRAPSGFLPAILPLPDSGDTDAIGERLGALGTETLPWGQLVAALRRHLPGARFVVWRHEHLSRVWPRVLSELIGAGRGVPGAGLEAFTALGLSAEAAVRLRHYLAANPPRGAAQLAATAEVFGRRFGRAPVRDMAAAYPGWMREQFARLDQGYMTEWADIASQQGVDALH